MFFNRLNGKCQIIIIAALAVHAFAAPIPEKELKYQNKADAKRVSDVHKIAYMVEQFKAKTGYYPLAALGEKKKLSINVVISHRKVEFEVPTVSMAKFKQELESGLARKVKLPLDPQDNKSWRMYQYYTNGEYYSVSAVLFFPTEFTWTLGEFAYKYQVSSVSAPGEGLFLFKEVESKKGGRRINQDLQGRFLHAMQNDNVKEMAELMPQGVVLDRVCESNMICKPLSSAILNGYSKEVIEFLLANGADPDGSNAYGDTPLIYALTGSRYDIVELLLKAGADVNKPNAFGISPFIGVCGEGNLKFVKKFLEYSANVNDNYRNLTSAKSSNNPLIAATPLIMAALEGHLEVVKLLLENGADVSKKDSSGKTALHYAKENSHKQVLELLRASKKSLRDR